MSKIVLVAKVSNPEAVFLLKLRQMVGGSLGDIRTRLKKGAPLLEATIFGNDHEEQAKRLRSIADEAEAAGLQLRVFELDPDEEFEKAPHNECENNIEIMRNILDDWDHVD